MEPYKYFYNIDNEEDLKRRYRKLCFLLHPDVGGDEDKFKEMHVEYTYILETGEISNKGFDDDYKAVVDELIVIMEERDYKRAWVYFRFVEMFEHELRAEHFAYMGKKLGYKDGWAYFRALEHNINV